MITFFRNIPITVSPPFWMVVGLLGWLNTNSLVGMGIWTLAAFFSVLIHEYGHACTAKLFGQQVEIHFVALGGVTQREGDTLKSWQEFLVVLNGPLAGFLLFGLSYYMITFFPSTTTLSFYLLRILVEINLFWTILNLFPLLPLDGGQLLRIILEKIWGLQGIKFVWLWSIVFASIVAILFFFLQQLLAGAIFFLFAVEAYKNWSALREFTAADEDTHLQELLSNGIQKLQAGEKELALEDFTSIRQQAPKGNLYVTATQYGAHILAQQGNVKRAYEWLMPVKNRLPLDYQKLLQQLAYCMQEWEEALKIGNKIYAEQANKETAVLNALVCGIKGERLATLGWLQCVKQFDPQAVLQLIQKREFDVVRHTSEFQVFEKNLKKLH